MAAQFFNSRELMRLALFQDRINGAGRMHAHDPEPVAAYAIHGESLYTICRASRPDRLEYWGALRSNHTRPSLHAWQAPMAVQVGDIVVERTRVLFDEETGRYAGIGSDVAVSADGPHGEDPESIRRAGLKLIVGRFGAVPDQDWIVARHGAVRLETRSHAFLPYGWDEAYGRTLDRMTAGGRPQEARLSLLQHEINTTLTGACSWFVEPNGRDLHKVLWDEDTPPDYLGATVVEHSRIETADGSDPPRRAGTPYVRTISSTWIADDPWVRQDDDKGLLEQSQGIIQKQRLLDGEGELPAERGSFGVARPDAPVVFHTTGEQSHPALDLDNAIVETMERDIADQQKTRGTIRPNVSQPAQDARTRFRAQVEQRAKQKLAARKEPKAGVQQPAKTR